VVDVLILCTGNAARSVMAATSLSARRPDLRVATGGTLVVDGQPMSIRTRAAIEGVGLAIPRHASRQVHPPDLDAATLVMALAPEHVEWVRRVHEPAAPRTVTLRRLVAHLPAAPTLADQIAALRPHDVALEAWEEVVDPGGGEADVFAACAREIDALVAELAPRLAGARR
jgi:protein-tyrosine-phosphatase